MGAPELLYEFLSMLIRSRLTLVIPVVEMDHESRSDESSTSDEQGSQDNQEPKREMSVLPWVANAVVGGGLPVLTRQIKEARAEEKRAGAPVNPDRYPRSKKYIYERRSSLTNGKKAYLLSIRLLL